MAKNRWWMTKKRENLSDFRPLKPNFIEKIVNWDFGKKETVEQFMDRFLSIQKKYLEGSISKAEAENEILALGSMSAAIRDGAIKPDELVAEWDKRSTPLPVPRIAANPAPAPTGPVSYPDLPVQYSAICAICDQEFHRMVDYEKHMATHSSASAPIQTASVISSEMANAARKISEEVFTNHPGLLQHDKSSAIRWIKGLLPSEEKRGNAIAGRILTALKITEEREEIERIIGEVYGRKKAELAVIASRTGTNKIVICPVCKKRVFAEGYLSHLADHGISEKPKRFDKLSPEEQGRLIASTHLFIELFDSVARSLPSSAIETKDAEGEIFKALSKGATRDKLGKAMGGNVSQNALQWAIQYAIQQYPGRQRAKEDAAIPFISREISAEVAAERKLAEKETGWQKKIAEEENSGATAFRNVFDTLSPVKLLKDTKQKKEVLSTALSLAESAFAGGNKDSARKMLENAGYQNIDAIFEKWNKKYEGQFKVQLLLDNPKLHQFLKMLEEKSEFYVEERRKLEERYAKLSKSREYDGERSSIEVEIKMMDKELDYLQNQMQFFKENPTLVPHGLDAMKWRLKNKELSLTSQTPLNYKVDKLIREMQKEIQEHEEVLQGLEQKKATAGDDDERKFYDAQIEAEQEEIKFLEDEIKEFSEHPERAPRGFKAQWFLFKNHPKTRKYRKKAKQSAPFKGWFFALVFLLIAGFWLFVQGSAADPNIKLWKWMLYLAMLLIFLPIKLKESRLRLENKTPPSDWLSKLVFWLFWLITANPLFITPWFGGTATGFLLYSTIAFVIYIFYFYGEGISVPAMIAIIFIAFLFLVFLSSGWGSFIEEKAADVEAQLGAVEAIGKSFAAIGDMFNNIWLLVSNPNQWYTRQFIDKGTRAEGDTSQALELVAAQVIPGSASKGDTLTMQTELENKGKDIAKNVVYTIELDGRASEHKASVPQSSKNQPVGDIFSGEKRVVLGDFIAPECAGTFGATSKLSYDYGVVGITNLELIDGKAYTELTTQNKLKFKDPLSVSSAGPFKITLRTDRQQPIPTYRMEGSEIKLVKFKIFLGIINEKTGTAKITENKVEIPKELVPESLKSDMTVDPDKCNFVPQKSDDGKSIKSNGDFNIYTLNGDKGGSRDLQKIQSQDLRIFSCEMVFDYSQAPEGIADIKTFLVRTNLSYQYHTTKKSTFTVRREAEGIKTCADLDAEEAKQPKEYVADVVTYCGSGSPQGLQAPQGERWGHKEYPNDGYIQASGTSDSCQIWAHYVPKDKYSPPSEQPQNPQIPEDPITELKVECHLDNANDADLEKDGWKKATDKGQLMDIESVFEQSHCHLLYKRGKQTPIFDVASLTHEDHEPYSTYIYANGPELEATDWAGHGHVIYKPCVGCQNIPVCSGNVALTFNPNPTSSGTNVKATASGISQCFNKPVKVSSANDCSSPVAECTAWDTGCQKDFNAPSSTTTYRACIDKNGNGNYNDEGEKSADVVLTIS